MEEPQRSTAHFGEPNDHDLIDHGHKLHCQSNQVCRGCDKSSLVVPSFSFNSFCHFAFYSG